MFPKITDILQNIPNDRPYCSLKAFLLKKYSSTTSDSVSALLHTCRRSDDSVLDYFQRHKTTLGDAFEPESNFQTELLRHCLLNSVDVDVRINLYHFKHLPLDEFVKHADQLLQCKQGLHTFSSAHTLSSTPVSPPPHNQHVINELLESRLKDIQECVNNLADSTIRYRLHNMPPLDSNSFPPDDTGFPSERPNLHSCDTSSQTNTQAAKSLCYFHSSYGDKAYRCTGHGCANYRPGRLSMSKNHCPNFTA